MHAKRRFFFFLTSALLSATAACTLLLNRDDVQCSTSGDCAKFAATAQCVDSVCVLPDGGPANGDSGQDANNATDVNQPDTNEPNDSGVVDAHIGFDGCFEGTPTTAEQFLNACTKATCLPFDDCARLGICDGGFPGTAPPPPPGPGSTQADSGASQLCSDIAAAKQGVAAGNQKTVIVTGSSNFPPFLTSFSPVLYTKTGYGIIWQTTNSCTGVDVIHNQFSPSPNATKQAIRETKNHGSTRYYDDKGVATPCFLDGDTAVDVGESDIFGQSCAANIGYDPTTQVPAGNVGEFFGPVLPMVFVVSSGSSQRVISAAAGQSVFGKGEVPDAGANSLPYNDPNRLFIRSSSTATNQMMSRAINVDPTKWWASTRAPRRTCRTR